MIMLKQKTATIMATFTKMSMLMLIKQRDFFFFETNYNILIYFNILARKQVQNILLLGTKGYKMQFILVFYRNDIIAKLYCF